MVGAGAGFVAELTNIEGKLSRPIVVKSNRTLRKAPIESGV